MRTVWRPPGVPVLILIIVTVLPNISHALKFLGQRDTYARYPKWNACQNASISFEFRTSQPSALLLYTEDNRRYDYLQLALTKGHVRLWINFETDDHQLVDIEANTDALNDGQWHRVEIRRNRMETILYVDGTQTSKVALGSDTDFGRDPNADNYIFFGGLPVNFRSRSQQRRQQQQKKDAAAADSPQEDFTESRFRGDIRNILYFNCSCIPVRTSMVDGRGVSQARVHQEACEVRDPGCPEDCPCVSVDDGAGCECNYKRECLKDILANYELPMDEMIDRTLVNPSGLDSVVEGGARLVPGVRKNALLIDGRSQWLRVTGGGHRRECMGDLSRCDKGYYMGMWLQFRGVGYQRGVYLSNGGHSTTSHGVALMYSKGRLDVIFKMADGREWRTRSHDVLEGRWYHVAATWSQDKGLFLYVNGQRTGTDRSPSQKRAANENSRFNGFYIGRANDNSGTERLGQVLVDDFSFVSSFMEEKDVRESGGIYHYYLPMDKIEQDRVSGRGLQARVYGAASQVDGKVGGAILLSGGREYLDLGNVQDSCLGDLDLCRYGVYVSMWVLFNRLDRGRKVLLASPSLGIYQDGNRLIGGTQNLRQSWEAQYPGLEIGSWYFVELSWSPTEGLALYVDRQRVGSQATPSYRPPEPVTSMNMYVGRDASQRSASFPAATVDELEMLYGDRETLQAIDFIQRDRPRNQHFTMDAISRGRLVHDTMVVSTVGRPQEVSGKVGSAILMDGVQDALDFGDRATECFGNLDHCPHGFMLSLWLRPEQLQERAYYVSSGNNGLNLEYRGGKLVVSAATTSKTWEISTSDFSPDKWHFLEVSFHPQRGLRLYNGGRLVAETDQPKARDDPEAGGYDLDRFYLGRGNVDMRRNKFGGGAYDELDVWYADRDYLTSHGFIQRSRPENIIVHFEELADQTRVVHPSLDIRLIGRPGLEAGKVGNALRLRGRGQYADLGQLSHTCMGNLARCQQGITVSAWMKFRSFENNMVFLSTGDNGLLLMYKDGYMQVSADGRSLVTAPRFEPDRWYLVEISWHPDHGLKFFVDNKLVGEAPASTYPASPRRDSSHFYVGRPNDRDLPGGRYATGDFDIDELEVWSGRREDLLAFGYIDRVNQGYEAFSMDSAQGDRLAHARFIVLLVNGARLIPGRVGNALELRGRGQYLDLGPHLDSCLGNLDLCPHGFTLSVWLKPTSLEENHHFLAAPSYALFYEDGELKADFNSAGKTWTVGTPRFRAGEWQRVTLTWHQKKGLSLFVDDELMDTSYGEARLQRDAPASEHVYLGRNLADTRLTAQVEADELKVWYEYLDQLRTTGQYEVEVNPRRITFDNIQNGYIILRDGRIQLIGDIRLISGLGQNSKAVVLDGRSQYLDLGRNFTCNGDLNTCRQGATFRFAFRPDQLRDGTYFVDSFPMKLYYKDGRLQGMMQTADRVWTVDTTDFRPNRYSRVEMTWHPTQGLTMYIDGRRVDSETYPRERPPISNTDWRTYLGRPLNPADGYYANTVIDNLEFYNAYRDYVPEDRYLTLIRDQPVRPVTPYPPTRRPIVNRTPWPPETGRVSTARPTIPPGRPEDRRTTTIIRLDGRSFVRFNFDRLPPEYLARTPEEEFSFYFLTEKRDGLIWYHEEPRRNLYIAMKNGYLTFVNDPKNGRPEEVVLGQANGRRFDDYRWHHLKIRRNGRRIRLTVDDQNLQEYIFSEDVQFLTPAQVWLGGTPNTYEKTSGSISNNFEGGIGKVIYVTTSRQGSRIFRNEVNLITQLGEGDRTGKVTIVTIPDPWTPGGGGPVVIPPERTTPRYTRPRYTTTQRPPQPRTTGLTVINTGVVMPLPRFGLKSSSSVSFNFKTLNENGLILFAGDGRREFMGVELVDGRLYFVHNFGRGPIRSQFSQRHLADGQNHEVEMLFYDSHIDLRVDSVRKRLDLNSGERLPSSMGDLYVAGVPNYQSLPWMFFSRQSYLGCLTDLRVDSRIVDFESYVNANFGRVVRGCQAMPLNCLQRPCQNSGPCKSSMTDFLCDCSKTAFRGPRCNIDAWTALFNGSVWGRLEFSQTQKSHSDDVSFRFRSPLRDSLLFETYARNSNVFLRSFLENGRIKVETNLGGELKTLYSGQNLNDLQWHTVYIQRRGNEMEVWVDDEEHETATLAGQGYYLDIDRIYVGGTDGSDDRYIGYLQNFYLGKVDVLETLRGKGLDIGSFVSLPPLIYHPVTFPEFNSHLRLPQLHVPLNMVLHFMFKTREPSGLLLLSTGRGQDFLAVELFEGRLYIQFNPGEPMRISAPQTVNDGKWHAVTIQTTAGNRKQFLLTVDGLPLSVAYPGQDGFMQLKGPLYIGGAPQEVLQKDFISNNVFSRTGFRGCLASVDLSGQVPDLVDVANGQKVTIFDSCTDLTPSVCKEGNKCQNFGQCIESGSGGFVCDCSLSAHIGSICTDQPIGYRYRKFGDAGMISYSLVDQPTTKLDEIAFGVMTYQKDALLLRAFSEIIGDFVEFRLRDGYIVVEYDTNASGGKQTLHQFQKRVNDGRYYIVRFIRSANESTLYVDGLPGIVNVHSSAHGSFDRMSKIYIGGGLDQNQQIVQGFNGILGGLYVNGRQVFVDANNGGSHVALYGDVFVAPRPFNLTKGDTPTYVITTPKPNIYPTTAPIGPIIPGPEIPVIPGGVGGGGLGWVPGPGSVDTEVYPGAAGGSGVLVPGPASAAGGPQVAALVATPPALPGAGTRAGAVVGTILGIMALASSMMWAFYRCKPGMCACCSPGGAGGGAGAPMAISSPRPGNISASNKGAVLAAGGDVGGGASGVSGGGYGSNFQSASHVRSASSDMMDTGPASVQAYHYEGGGGAGSSSTADYDLATGVHSGYQSNTLQAGGGSMGGGSLGGGGGGFSSSTMQSSYNYSVKTVRTVSGQQQLMGYAGANQIGVPPGALGEEVRVDCCLMTNDGDTVVTGSSLGPPQVWDMKNGELLRTMQGDTVGSTNLHLACNDRLLVGAINADLEANQYSVPKGVHNYMLQIWDFTTRRALDMADVEVCSALTMMSDNDKVVFARSDKFGGGTNVVVWDLLGNQPIKHMRYDAPVGNNDYVHFLALSQNDRYVVAGFTNSFDSFAEFIVFDMTLTSYTVSDPSILRLDANPDCTAVLPRDEAVTGLRNGDLVIWSLRTGQPSRQLMSSSGRHAHAGEVTAVARSEDSRYLVSASADGTLKLWDVETERHINTLSGHTDEVWCCAISPDNDIIVSGSRDRTIRLWRLKNGSEICSFNAGVDIFHVTMSRNKATIVALGDKTGARKLIMLQVVRTKVVKQISS